MLFKKHWASAASYILLFLAIYAVFSYADAYEWFYNASRTHEAYELDEILLAVPAAMFCLALFTFRQGLALRRANRELREHSEALAASRQDIQTHAFAKDEFLAMACHELKTPLNGIIGALMLAEDISDNDEVKDNIRLAQIAASDLKNLISDVLEFSHIKYHGKELSFHPFQIRRTLGHIQSVIQRQVEQKGIRLSMEVGGNVPETITSHEGWIRLTVLNILGNAAKFTRHGSISLCCGYAAAPQNSLLITITDTGEGIPPQEIENIFLPYAQGAGNEAGSAYTGVGLGLYVVKEILSRMGGKIIVDSVPNQGTTFTLIFPTQATPSTFD